eukprot:TRINITY_DN9407_c0_g1_i2.p3 TRINITY_DN9407_c0_g1~~TRINITY_DN9407_c0_g1_i2.p3  ORF type:complete len:227 (+),score=37.23 TRINITY_DN9407_c0_g1_i2:680-1360(+)
MLEDAVADPVSPPMENATSFVFADANLDFPSCPVARMSLEDAQVTSGIFSFFFAKAIQSVSVLTAFAAAAPVTIALSAAMTLAVKSSVEFSNMRAFTKACFFLSSNFFKSNFFLSGLSKSNFFKSKSLKSNFFKSNFESSKNAETNVEKQHCRNNKSTKFLSIIFKFIYQFDVEMDQFQRMVMIQKELQSKISEYPGDGEEVIKGRLRALNEELKEKFRSLEEEYR